MQTFRISFPCELCCHKRSFEIDTLHTDRIGSNTFLFLSTATSSLSSRTLHNILEPYSFSILKQSNKSSTKSQCFKACLVTVGYVEVDFRKKMAYCTFFFSPAACKQNDFTLVNSPFIQRIMIPGPPTSCFSFTTFLSGTH